MNFVQFATTYKVVKVKLAKLPENVIPRIFPTCSPNTKGQSFALYWTLETVVDIIFQDNHQPPDLPIAVMIKFENYRGHSYNVDRQFCVPICPITVSS